MRHRRTAVGDEVDGSGKDQRLVVVALLMTALVLPPLVTAASRAGQLFGLPAVWIYLFAVWAVLTLVVALLVRGLE